MKESVVERVVFENTIEGLLRIFTGRMTPELQRRFGEVGLDVGRRLLPAYSLKQFAGILAVALDAHAPGAPRSEALLSLGVRFVECYFETPLGVAMHAVLKTLGPRRAVERLPKTLRAGNNYMQATVHCVSDTEYDVHINDVAFAPEFTQGMLLGAMQGSGARDLQVDILRLEGRGCTYRLRWAA